VKIEEIERWCGDGHACIVDVDDAVAFSTRLAQDTDEKYWMSFDGVRHSLTSLHA